MEMLFIVCRNRPVFQSHSTARRQRFTVAVPDEPVLVDGDLVRLTQVLSNLLNNASKYSDDGKAIRLDTCAADAAVAISVTDEGVGIAPIILSTCLVCLPRGTRHSRRYTAVASRCLA